LSIKNNASLPPDDVLDRVEVKSVGSMAKRDIDRVHRLVMEDNLVGTMSYALIRRPQRGLTRFSKNEDPSLAHLRSKVHWRGPRESRVRLDYPCGSTLVWKANCRGRLGGG